MQPAAAPMGLSTLAACAKCGVGASTEGGVGCSSDPFPSISPPPVTHTVSEDGRYAAALVEAEEEARKLSSDDGRYAAALVEEEEEARRLAELGPTFECSVCLDEEVPQLAGHRLRCGHAFCIGCIGQHVKLKVEGHHVSKETLTCPSCVQPLTVEDVHALTWRCGDDATWERFATAADEALIESLVTDGRARRCPGDTCNYCFEWADGDPRSFDCPACRRAFCLACPCVGGGVGPAHPGRSCAEYEEELRADAEAKRRLVEWQAENGRADERFRELIQAELRSGATKPCPKCRQAITKNGGCHHHECSSCKTKFCWNCGGFNAALPGVPTCRTTCSKAAVIWWREAELFGAPTQTSSSSGAAGGPASRSPSRAPSSPSGGGPIVSLLRRLALGATR